MFPTKVTLSSFQFGIFCDTTRREDRREEMKERKMWGSRVEEGVKEAKEGKYQKRWAYVTNFRSNETFTSATRTDKTSFFRQPHILKISLQVEASVPKKEYDK